jgi:hypothetical protein
MGEREKGKGNLASVPILKLQFKQSFPKIFPFNWNNGRG